MRKQIVVVVACIWTFVALPEANGQDPADEGGPLSKLTLHGFLSQAYARSDGGELFGITEDGTTDYRTAALQFRYSMTPDDDFVLQLSHERRGASPLAQTLDDVEMDWIFYQHRFSDSFSLRAGKIKVPMGAYNEVRDVGTLLPFYRAAEAVYPTIGLVPETLTGLAVATRLGEGRFSLDADFYGGEYELRNATSESFRSPVRKAAGFQLWLNTPLPGWRIGVGGSRGDLSETAIIPPGTTAKLEQMNASVQGKLGPVQLTVEYLEAAAAGSRYEGYYGELSWPVSDRVGLHVQHSKSDLVLNLIRVGGPRLDLDFSEDTAFGVSFRVRPEVVLKAEYHQFDGYTLEGDVASFFGPPSSVDYGIASVSTSF